MGINAKDTDVFQLLQKLKESNGSYPTELLASRRQGYLKQVAEITAAAGLAAALRNTAKTAHGTGAGLSSTASTLLETLLVVAIVAEAGAVTYFYRDRLVALYNKLTKSPQVEQVVNPPVIPSAIAEVNFSVTPVFTVAATATVTATPSAIPSQFVEESAAPVGSNDDGNEAGSVTMTSQESNPGSSQAVSTPNPNDSHNNNGNHYGQTPIPARTKESDTHNNQPPDTQNKSQRNH